MKGGGGGGGSGTHDKPSNQNLRFRVSSLGVRGLRVEGFGV